MTTVTEEQFREYVASFAGMDGGNPNAKFWICGIEHGGEVERFKFQPEGKLGAWSTERKSECGARRWQYWQRLSKLIVHTANAVHGGAAASLGSDWKKYLEQCLHSETGWDLKLNLYPIPSSCVADDAWAHAFRDEHLLRSKASYQGFCRQHRFPKLASMVLEHVPRVIMCTGTTFKAEFAEAFGFAVDDASFRAVPLETKFSRGQTCNLLVNEAHRAGLEVTLVVVPFPGRPFGLTSNAMLEEAGKVLARFFKPEDFPLNILN